MKDDEKQDKGNLIYLSEHCIPKNYSFSQVKDFIFDALNESPYLPLKDLNLIDKLDMLEITLKDGSVYELLVHQKKR